MRGWAYYGRSIGMSSVSSTQAQGHASRKAEAEERPVLDSSNSAASVADTDRSPSRPPEQLQDATVITIQIFRAAEASTAEIWTNTSLATAFRMRP